MSIGINGKYIIGFDGEEHRLLKDGVVIYEGNRIKHVGKSYSGPVGEWIDASTGLVIPGLINTHLHAAGAPNDKSFLEDVGVRPLYGSNLGENLTALNLSTSKEDKEILARYSLAECLRSGNTTVVEIGMVPSIGEKKTVDMIGEMGIRACEGHSLGDGAMERSDAYNFYTRWLGLETGLKRLEKAEKFVEKYRGAHDGRLMPALYPSGVASCSFEFQKAIREKSDELEVPVSIHAGEWVVEFQKRPFRHSLGLDFLNRF